jgi:hypothetical protein
MLQYDNRFTYKKHYIIYLWLKSKPRDKLDVSFMYSEHRKNRIWVKWLPTIIWSLLAPRRYSENL